ncbi:hypothetical protein [Sphingomonas sp. Leaf242]|uniref:hypothetical protein n=1 Tax=Sphingomonas sp. Leaf242 TaxID=1736304 RepID=UPI00071540AD|nr:hypothetical protein [Sphingomonas sp. Leaf242]KQO13423.1 hypothetical protein ASF09_04070 [Sphingomonas sp. Leaf242]
MSDNSTEAAPQTHPQVVTMQNGTPVVIRTETQVPVTPPQNKDAMFNVTQAGVYLAFVVLLITAVVSSMKWLDGKLEKLGVRVSDEMKEVKQDVKDAERRILDVERQSVALDKRLALQEQESRAIKDGQDRIEHRLEKMEKEGKEGRAEIIESLRELREVKPR